MNTAEQKRQRIQWCESQSYHGHDLGFTIKEQSFKNQDLVHFYKGMIAILQSFSPLRNHSKNTAENMFFYNLPSYGLVYKIFNHHFTDCLWQEMLVATNTGNYPLTVSMDQKIPKD